jgi:glycosyltransferase involved in cell wall biosynthesis
LGRQSAITVTGRVPDVRAYVAHATAVVAPLRIARGLQNKVLEGMSMARPVVATPAACQGLEPEICRNVLRADGARDFAEQIVSLLSTELHDAIGRRARESVKQGHDWTKNLSALVPLLSGGPIVARPLPQWSTS